jgi:hypothetical protein
MQERKAVWGVLLDTGIAHPGVHSGGVNVPREVRGECFVRRPLTSRVCLGGEPVSGEAVRRGQGSYSRFGSSRRACARGKRSCSVSRRERGRGRGRRGRRDWVVPQVTIRTRHELHVSTTPLKPISTVLQYGTPMDQNAIQTSTCSSCSPASPASLHHPLPS